MILNDFSHIRFGSWGEGIYYTLNEQECEIWFTWYNGFTVYLDDLKEYDLTDDEKTRMISEIIDFILVKEQTKPILCFNIDYKGAKLWEELAYNKIRDIKAIEITNIEESNKNLYQLISDDLKTGYATHIFDGFKVKTLKDLDKYWHRIKE